MKQRLVIKIEYKSFKYFKNTYSKAKHYKSVIPFIEDLYNEAGNLNTISEINFHFLRAICDYLDINTKISFSSDYNLLAEGKTERLVDLCEQTSATKYFTGSVLKHIWMKIYSKKGY